MGLYLYWIDHPTYRIRSKTQYYRHTGADNLMLTENLNPIVSVRREFEIEVD